MVSFDRHYAEMADRQEGRDHDVNVAYAGRITQSEGAFGRAWMRYNPGVQLVSVFDDGGREWFLTPNQAKVYDLARTFVDNGVTRMRWMAKELGVAASTVSRALWKLQAIGLIAFIAGRGRYAGLLIINRAKDDGLERFRKVAKAKLRAWREAAERRVLRLKINVASCYSWREVEDHGYGNVYVDVMGATLNRPWTIEEVEDSLKDSLR